MNAHVLAMCKSIYSALTHAFRFQSGRLSRVCPIASSWLWRSSTFYVETTETRHIFSARLVWEHSSRLAVLRKEKEKRKKEGGKPGKESKRMAFIFDQ